MKDRRWFSGFLIISILLIALSILFNIIEEGFSKDLVSYLERRFYYERVISRKGLSLERARYWREER